MSYGKNTIYSKDKKKRPAVSSAGKICRVRMVTPLMNENHRCPRDYVRIFDLDVLHPTEFGKES